MHASLSVFTYVCTVILYLWQILDAYYIGLRTCKPFSTSMQLAKLHEVKPTKVRRSHFTYICMRK